MLRVTLLAPTAAILLLTGLPQLAAATAATRPRTVAGVVTPADRAAAVNRVALTRGARALAVKVAQAAQVRAQVVRAAAVSQVRAVSRQGAQAKPPLSPAQASPMQRAEAQTAAARAQPAQAMVVMEVRAVSLVATAAQVLLWFATLAHNAQLVALIRLRVAIQSTSLRRRGTCRHEGDLRSRAVQR